MVTQDPTASDEGVDTSSEPEPEPRLARAADALSDAVARLTEGRPERFSTNDTPASPPNAEDRSDDEDDDGDGADSAGRDRRGVTAALSGVVTGLAAGARAGRRGAVLSGAFLAELLTTTAARLPLRDKATLQTQHPDRDVDELAQDLIQAAARLTGTVGGAAGGLAAVQWLATPSLIAVPIELAAETLLIAAIELKLVAELHEIYDARPSEDRASAYLESWTTQRGLVGTAQGERPGVTAQLTAFGTAALRKRITGRLARNLGSFLPFLAGAAIGARNNSTATNKLGRRVHIDLAARPQKVRSQRLTGRGPRRAATDGDVEEQR